MKLSSVALLLPAFFLTCATVSAESYRSFSHINYSKTDYSNADSDSWSLGSKYYFDDRETLGPLNEFDYINAISNVSVDYGYHTSDSIWTRGDYTSTSALERNTVSINGEWFVGNFLIGGGYRYANNDSSFMHSIDEEDGLAIRKSNYNSDSNRLNLSLGYLITKDFIIKADFRENDNLFTYSANYNLELNDSDYIGFGYASDEDFDAHHFSSRYFMALSEHSYLVLGGTYTFNNYDSYWDIADSWHINGSYYFNQNTSVTATYDKDDEYSVSANHFFTKNYALALSYSANSSNDDFDAYSINFTAQF